MATPWTWQQLRNLTLGVNYRDTIGGVNARDGEASDCQDVLPREDGAIYKSAGWIRFNPSQLSGIPVAQRGFTYRGKNTVVGDTRPGNWGVANDGADFTRRKAEYPGFLLLTSTNAYVWDPINEAVLDVTGTVPVGVNITQETKPTIEVLQDNCYIVGWADQNLRFDPADQAFYRWGWEEVPSAPAAVASGGGDLIQNATYKYAISFQDIYTGEETKMSDSVSQSGSRAYFIDASGIFYNGVRHANPVPGTDQTDVRTVIWRTGADDDSFRFLVALDPGVFTYTDDGDAREASLRPFRGIQQDEPRFSAIHQFKGKIYCLAKSELSNRVYNSSLDRVSFYERFEPLGFVDLDVPDGEVLTAIGSSDASLLVYTQRGCFRVAISTSLSQQQAVAQRLPWRVGAVGPRARKTVDGWEYFTSERGPYRWKEGLTGPQHIGENLLPLFVDPTSGLCKLNEKARELCEIEFEWATSGVHFTFPLGNTTIANFHFLYWHMADFINGDYRLGWFPLSTVPQAMDETSALQGATGGVPDSPREKKPALTFSDALGYLSEYSQSGPVLKRGSLGAAERAVTTAVSTAGNVLTVSDTDLYATGDGMRGMRLEIEHVGKFAPSGLPLTTEWEIASNTASTVTITAAAFSEDPVAGDIVRFAGIPAFWRSWSDHFGQPHQHKHLMNVSLGYQDRYNPDGEITILVSGGSRVGYPVPATYEADLRSEAGTMNKWRRKMTASMTGVFFIYELANSKPDELFLITNLEREVQVIPVRRKA